jgi:hypothetical protein
MRNTEQNLSTALGELRCLSSDRDATLDELTALNAARDAVDELLRACVTELRSNSRAPKSWGDISYALGDSSASATRQRFGSRPVRIDDQASAFWEAFAPEFIWDFLPTDFLHALYVDWMASDSHAGAPASKESFTRRLKAAATPAGDWIYVRSRPGSMMDGSEPLTDRAPSWSLDTSDKAIYGLRRASSMRAA